MNIDPEKFTEMGVGAIREMQEVARRNGQQEVDSWHLLSALVGQEDGIAPSLLDEMGVGASAVQLGLQRELDTLPKISGNMDTARSYVSSTLSEVIEKAQALSKEMEDDYVSTEHLLLGLVEVGKPVGLNRFFKNFAMRHYDRHGSGSGNELFGLDSASTSSSFLFKKEPLNRNVRSFIFTFIPGK